MAERAPAWVVPVMRAGYGGRGIVYTVVGVLAVLAAWQGSRAEGTTDALKGLQDSGWGVFVLVLIAIGMFAYAIWRVIDSLMDLEDYGTDGKGVVARTGMIVTGLIHLGLGVYVLSLLFTGGGGGGSGSGGGAEGLTAMVMQQSWGRYLVGFAGICTMGAGLYYFKKGYKEEYRDKLHLTRTTEKLNPAMKFGLYAHGVVVLLIGIFLFWAAWTYDSSQAGGLGQAFDVIRSAAYGRLLLGLVALGLVAFAVFLFVNAVYRIVPRRAGDDVKTLATKAKRKAEAAAR